MKNKNLIATVQHLKFAQRDAEGLPEQPLIAALTELLESRLDAPLLPPESPESPKQKIYVFSNVKYPEKNKIKPEKDDLCVFLNKAESIGYYADHANKIVYHRSPKECYGAEILGVKNRYVFDAGDLSIPKDFIKKLKSTYDWNYEIEAGKVKCATTGYMVVKYLEGVYPDREIVLVNFGYEVQKSTYRCPYHNWKFEAEQLKSFKHLYLEEKNND